MTPRVKAKVESHSQKEDVAADRREYVDIGERPLRPDLRHKGVLRLIIVSGVRSSLRQLYTANLASILPHVDSDFRLTRTRRNDKQLGSRDCLRVDRDRVVHVFLFRQ